MRNDALVDGLATGATPCGAKVPKDQMKVAGRDPMPAGIRVTSEQVIFESFKGDLYDDQGWNFGNRQINILSRFGAFGNFWVEGQTGKVTGQRGIIPAMWIKPGAGFDLMEHATLLDCRAAMVLKQETGGVAKVIRRTDMRGMQQDAIKVSGGNHIHENMIGLCKWLSDLAHADTFTIMAALGGVLIENNNIQWTYAGRASQKGINNLFRIGAYKIGAVFDDIDVRYNLLRQLNPNSVAWQVLTSKSPVWHGSIHVHDNRMEKAGGLQKILYAPTSRITRWDNNTDITTGKVIPLSAT